MKTFFKDGGRKRSKGLTELDALVEVVFHLITGRIRQDRPVPQGSWPPLESPLDPADDPAFGDVRRGTLDKVVADLHKRQIEVREQLTCRVDIDLLTKPRGWEVREPWMAHDVMPRPERCTEGSACITRRRVNLKGVEGAVLQKDPVGDTVQGNATREAEVGYRHEVVEVVRQSEECALCEYLQAGCDVRPPSPIRGVEVEGLSRTSCPSEQLFEGRTERAIGAVLVGDERSVDGKGPIGLELEKRLELGHKPRFAICGEAHHLVLAVVDAEPKKGSDGAVHHADAVREVHFCKRCKGAAMASVEGGGRPFPHAIRDKHCGVVQPRRVEGRCGMGQVMLTKEQLLAGDAECTAEAGAHPELVGQPGELRLAERCKAAWEVLELCHEDSLVLSQWTLVPDHMVEVSHRQPGGLKAEGRRLMGEGGVMLDA